MNLTTIKLICSYSVPWELDDKDFKIIQNNQSLNIRDIINKLWINAQKLWK